MTCISSCGDLSGWCAGLRFLAAPEGLDDAQLSAAAGAWFSEGERDDLGGLWVILFDGFGPEQGADLCYVALTGGAGKQAVVTDAVEPIREDVDQKAADETRLLPSALSTADRDS